MDQRGRLGPERSACRIEQIEHLAGYLVRKHPVLPLRGVERVHDPQYPAAVRARAQPLDGRARRAA